MNNKSLIYQKKKKALDLFVKSLLRSPVGKQIDRIILFGSLAKGEADELSDIDLMIFAKQSKKVDDLASDLSYDLLLGQGEAVEPHVYSVSDYQTPKNYFVKLATKTGQLIYPTK